jgi:hypothetical protein
VHVRPTGHNPVASELAPRIRCIWVQDDVHGLVIRRPIELLLLLHDEHIHLHLLECTQLRKPRLRLINDLELRHLKRVSRAKDVEIALEGDDMVVQRALRSLLDARSPFALCWIVKGTLKVSRGADADFEGAAMSTMSMRVSHTHLVNVHLLHMEAVIEHVVVVADCSDGSNDELGTFHRAELAEAIIVTSAGPVARERKVHVCFENAE